MRDKKCYRLQDIETITKYKHVKDNFLNTHKKLNEKLNKIYKEIAISIKCVQFFCQIHCNKEHKNLNNKLKAGFHLVHVSSVSIHLMTVSTTYLLHLMQYFSL